MVLVPGKRLVMATKLYYQSELTDKWKEGLYIIYIL